MAIARLVCLGLLFVLGLARLAEAQNAASLFIAADMVRGPGGSGPVCVLSSRFMRKEEVAWRIRVQDISGKELDNKGLKGVVVELSDGQKFPARFGGHPPKEPTAYLWSTAWVIPDDYPTGTFNYKVVATSLDGTTQTWEPVNTKASLLTIVAGTFEPAK
ncbi:MAG: hypothetical protein JO320_16295 [Alphaproteobacteria bacterium]|nr:hypothetical protein [Alphaproteobacteria bacterium]